MRPSNRILLSLLAGALTVAPAAFAQVTTRASVDSAGAEADKWSRTPALSGDGRYVVFYSEATNLVPGDTNGWTDVFVHDRVTGVTERVSISTTGEEATRNCYEPDVTPDGRYVAFTTMSWNFDPDDKNGLYDVYVRDRLLGTTTRGTLTSTGLDPGGHSMDGALTPDGRYLAFESGAGNIVPFDSNGSRDIFVRDLATGLVSRVSVSSTGTQGDADSSAPQISDDARLVVFESIATDLVPGDTNDTTDVFLHDRLTGLTTRVSVASDGTEGSLRSWAPDISGDGRFVSFHSEAPNLVPGDGNGQTDVFVHELATGATTLVSVSSTGEQGLGDQWSGQHGLSADGDRVVFRSNSGNLVPEDTNGASDVFVHERSTGLTWRVSVDSAGVEGSPASGLYGYGISRDGRAVAFNSHATNLVPEDTNGLDDVFVHAPELTLAADRSAAALGETVTFTAWGGVPGLPVGLVLVDASGAPVFLPLTWGPFDAHGAWTLPIPVPPGLAGLALGFRAYALGAAGGIVESNMVVVEML